MIVEISMLLQYKRCWELMLSQNEDVAGFYAD